MSYKVLSILIVQLHPKDKSFPKSRFFKKISTMCCKVLLILTVKPSQEG